MTPEEYILKWWKKKTVKMMAEDLGLKPEQVGYILHKHGISPISGFDLKSSIVLDHHESMTVAEIEKEFNIPAAIISVICRRWGIHCIKAGEKKRLQEKTNEPEPEKPHDPTKTFWNHIKPSESFEGRRL